MAMLMTSWPLRNVAGSGPHSRKLAPLTLLRLPENSWFPIWSMPNNLTNRHGERVRNTFLKNPFPEPARASVHPASRGASGHRLVCEVAQIRLRAMGGDGDGIVPLPWQW